MINYFQKMKTKETQKKNIEVKNENKVNKSEIDFIQKRSPFFGNGKTIQKIEEICQGLVSQLNKKKEIGKDTRGEQFFQRHLTKRNCTRGDRKKAILKEEFERNKFKKWENQEETSSTELPKNLEQS